MSFGYGLKPFLDVPAMEIRPGEFVGLLGPNGAGKSTYLRLLAGLLTPADGVVYICGHPVENLSPGARARLIAWVPQRAETPFEWTVAEMVATGRHPWHGRRLVDSARDRDAVRTALERVGLLALRARPVQTLSGGEWQRALIARALAQEGQLLLLDEPVANLDLGYQRQVYELVRSLCHQDGLAAVAADHHVDLQAIFCDRMMLLHDGRLLAQGPVESVLRVDVLERAYGTPLCVVEDPASGRPSVRWKFGGGP